MKFHVCVFIGLLVMSQASFFIEEAEKNIPPQAIGLILEAVAVAWKGIVKLFGVSVKTELTYVVTEKGFDFFDSSSHIQVLTNFVPVGLKKLENLLIKKWEGDSAKSREVIEALFLAAQITEKNTWSEHDVVFNKGATGEMVYGCLFTMALDNGNYHFVIVDSQSKFKLSRELYLLKTTKKFGVFASSSNTKLIYKDRDIDANDIESLMYFLQLVAYKTVAKHFGIGADFEYPTLE